MVLADAATGLVDSIDKLLEVDEGVTLEVTSDVPSCLSQAVATSTTAATHRPMAQTQAHGAGGAATPRAACRVDIPVSEWARSARAREEEEGGDGKYRKRRGATSQVMQVARWALALVGVVGGLYMIFGGASA